MHKTSIQELDFADDEVRKLYYREDLIFEVTEAISRAMKEKNVNKKELSRLTGISESRITRLLRGDLNARLTTIAAILHALDSKLLFILIPVKKCGRILA
uniref:Putative DNA binding, helix-turn-helix domain containing protein n=1 Tax=viral metagenome TaxID=1070528 RepID=A0A6M3IH57_9ZZZZ